MDLIGAAGGIREEWDELADRAGAPPFLRPGWIEPWQEAFGSGRPAYAVLRGGGRLRALLALQAARGALVGAANWHTPVYGALSEDAGAAEELIHGVVRRRAARLDLSMLDSADPGLAAARAAAGAASARVIERTVARSPYVELSGSFDEFMAARDRKFRKDIGRRWRRLDEAEGAEAVFEDGTERLDELLADGFRLEGSGWKIENGTAIVSDPRQQRFYRAVARWAAERGWLRLAFLRTRERAIAFDLCIEAGGVHYVPKGGFDVDYRKHGPGQLLTHAGIRRAYERGLDSYELLGQQDEYKRQWTDSVRARVRLQAFSRRPGGSASYLAWRYGRPLALRTLRGGEPGAEG